MFGYLADENTTRSMFTGMGGGTNAVRGPFEYRYTFSVPGKYQYECDVHENEMKGIITVTA